MDEKLKENPIIEEIIDKYTIIIGSMREAAKNFTIKLHFDLSIILDSINTNILQALNVFYLTPTVWLFEGEKISHLNETDQIENQSVHSLFSLASHYSIYSTLEKELEKRTTFNEIDIEDLEDLI